MKTNHNLVGGSCDLNFEFISSVELGGNLVVPTLGSAVGCHDVTGLGDQAPIVVLITFQGNAFDKLQQTITKHVKP